MTRLVKRLLRWVRRLVLVVFTALVALVVLGLAVEHYAPSPGTSTPTPGSSSPPTPTPSTLPSSIPPSQPTQPASSELPHPTFATAPLTNWTPNAPGTVVDFSSIDPGSLQLARTLATATFPRHGCAIARVSSEPTLVQRDAQAYVDCLTKVWVPWLAAQGSHGPGPLTVRHCALPANRPLESCRDTDRFAGQASLSGHIYLSQRGVAPRWDAHDLESVLAHEFGHQLQYQTRPTAGGELVLTMGVADPDPTRRSRRVEAQAECLSIGVMRANPSRASVLPRSLDEVFTADAEHWDATAHAFWTKQGAKNRLGECNANLAADALMTYRDRPSTHRPTPPVTGTVPPPTPRPVPSADYQPTFETLVWAEDDGRGAPEIDLADKDRASLELSRMVKHAAVPQHQCRPPISGPASSAWPQRESESYVNCLLDAWRPMASAAGAAPLPSVQVRHCALPQWRDQHACGGSTPETRDADGVVVRHVHERWRPDTEHPATLALVLNGVAAEVLQGHLRAPGREAVLALGVDEPDPAIARRRARLQETCLAGAMLQSSIDPATRRLLGQVTVSDNHASRGTAASRRFWLRQATRGQVGECDAMIATPALVA